MPSARTNLSAFIRYWDYLKTGTRWRVTKPRAGLCAIPRCERETRCLLGDHIYNRGVEWNHFEDRIFWVDGDIHNPDGIWQHSHNYHIREPYNNPFRSCIRAWRVCCSQDDAQVSVIFPSAPCVWSAPATTGQAAGTAAALCIQKCSPVLPMIV